MKAIARLNDRTYPHITGDVLHGDNRIITGSNNVYVNQKQTARTNDSVSCGDILGVGSPNIFVNNKAIARLKDSTKLHNAVIIDASNNVFAN